MPATAVMFPGQGAYLPGSLSELHRDARAAEAVGDVLDQADQAATEAGTASVSALLTDRLAPDADTLVRDEPERLHLALYAASLVSFRLLTGPLGLTPDLVLGHSVGELTALVAAGALTVADGARLLTARDAALRAAPPPPGGMFAVPLGARRIARLLEGCGLTRTHVAADNAPRQTVVSGPDDELDTLAATLDTLGLRHFRLSSAYPFHSPLLAPAAALLGPAVADTAVSLPALPVHSPTQGGHHRDTESIRSALAHHLVQPVDFRRAVTTLYGDGVERFVETGPKATLADLVEQSLPAAVCVAPLRTRVGLDGLRAALTGDAPALPTPGKRAGGLPERAALIEELRTLYAGDLEYPVDVMTADADLEADLAVGSVKQIELFSRALDRYGLPQPDAKLRVTTYTTLERVAGLLADVAGDAR
ncbi:acyltransferase domain-containing protein [Streptomyces roseirectus]|uniref:[acyl-carrier-protein] S-malonyltransferase n=1 Tax=Streptomyces roseirectus TaxID=2768066 RepID=A0A7H0I7T3_9ACTN|nr:acyltransferase domain-containing protein [Streptomyces roseirectus]QNP68849.1 acyltransferase domain-containing protein [Streptomyces roseirectus]